MKQTLFILFLLFVSFCLFSQSHDGDFEKKFSKQELSEDYEILINALKDGHPGIYEYITVEKFDSIVEQNRQLLVDSLSESDFHEIIRKLISNIGCGHTTAIPSNEFYKNLRNDLKMLPFEVYIDGNRLFVRQSLCSEYDLSLKEILSIDDISSSDILGRMRGIQQRDGYTQAYLNTAIENLFRTYYIFLFGQKDEYKIVSRDFEGVEQVVSIPSTDSVAPKDVFPLDPLKYEKRHEGASITLSYSLEKTDLAILRIAKFEQKNYKSTYKEIFKSLKQDGIKSLVIDLRDNSGGYFLNANILMTYLIDDNFEFVFNRPKKSKYDKEYITTDFFSMLTISLFKTKPDFKDVDGLRTYAFKYKPRKKNFFKGDIYVLTNGGTFSMSSCTSAYLSQLENVILLGSETGGGYDGSNAIINSRLEMPNTKVRVVLPNFHLIHQVPKLKPGQGVVPDVKVDYSIKDRFSKKDLEMEKVLDLIEKK